MVLLSLLLACSKNTAPAAGGDAAATAPQPVDTITATTVPAEPKPDAKLIPRSVLFGNPVVSAVKISPDGKHLAWRAPRDGVMNLWIAPADDLEAARPLTQDTHRGIPGYFWAPDSSALLFVQDRDGDENFHVWKAPIDGGESTDLTPIDGIRAMIYQVSERHPDTIWIGLNDRNPSLHDVYAVDLKTGDRELVLENEGYLGFEIDHDGKVRLAVKMTESGGMEIERRDGDGWAPFMSVPASDAMTTSVIGFDGTGEVLYLEDSMDRNTSALVAVNVASGERQVIGKSLKADYAYAMWHPTEHVPQAVAFEYDKVEWSLLDETVKADMAFLNKELDGTLDVVSRTDDDATWVVLVSDDDAPARYVRFDREGQKLTDLFVTRPDLEGQPLVPMHPVTITTRDRMAMVSYLTLPAAADADGDGKADAPVPMVLLVHGGPWARDSWGMNSLHQLLANRGYAVLSPNFRGSTGFGKGWINAGNKQWARKMHNDLIDATGWAVKQGVTTQDRVAIMGGSYGGYATLVGLTFTPEQFACGVDIVGPSNLVTLLESIPPYWAPMLEMFAKRVGDPRTEEGRALLEDRSPLGKVDAITKPLLIGQGANDPRVKQAESDQIVAAMNEHGIPVTYVLFPDEGHGFRKPENNLAFFGVAEAFLAECLGGAAEPVDITGSSIQVPNGADNVLGLKDALEDAGSTEGTEAGDAE